MGVFEPAIFGLQCVDRTEIVQVPWLVQKKRLDLGDAITCRIGGRSHNTSIASIGNCWKAEHVQ